MRETADKLTNDLSGMIQNFEDFETQIQVLEPSQRESIIHMMNDKLVGSLMNSV